MITKPGLALISALLGTMSAACPAYADDGYYYPRVAGTPAKIISGTLLDFGMGNRSGGFTILTSAGKRISIYTAKPPFRINHRIVDCPIPPQRGIPRDPDVCKRWPAGISFGRTAVQVPVWNGRRYAQPTLIARGFVTSPN